MTVDANSFIDDSFNDGDWSPQDAARYLEMSMNGDTSQGESIDTPADTAADEQTTEPEDKDDTPATEAPTKKFASTSQNGMHKQYQRHRLA